MYSEIEFSPKLIRFSYKINKIFYLTNTLKKKKNNKLKPEIE